MPKKYKFIDLFAGLGGFHLALGSQGHKCVFASELNPELQELYKINHGINCAGDINLIKPADIPKHDIICAGFPCTPFSKAGKQQGLNDPKSGNLFDRIMDIANYHNPEFIFLENVPNLKNHDKGNTWKYISDKLTKKYDISDKVLSPHIFGIPQHRSRIYIVCRLKSKGGLNNFEFPEPKKSFSEVSIHSIIESNPKDFVKLKSGTKNHLDVWQKFLNNLKPEDVPRFPIWSMEFGASYPFKNRTPFNSPKTELKKCKGKFGENINGNSIDELLSCLPTYAQSKEDRFPAWKIKYIEQNRAFYEKNKKWIDKWLKSVKEFEVSHQKFEWNCGNKNELVLNNKIVQFRPSGIRVKVPTFSPALVLTSTQIPMFPWLERYMTVREAARLQCMGKLKQLPSSTSKGFRAFGNAVNVCVVTQISNQLLK
jgi:DNA (cytosine-5)-methyltransferase 1